MLLNFDKAGKGLCVCVCMCLRLTASALQMVLAMWRHSVRSQQLFLIVSSPASWKLNSRFSCAVGGRTTSAKAFTHSGREGGRRISSESASKEKKPAVASETSVWIFGSHDSIRNRLWTILDSKLENFYGALIIQQIMASKQNTVLCNTWLWLLNLNNDERWFDDGNTKRS